MLLPLMVRGFTTPEKRINSVPVDGDLLLAHHAEVAVGQQLFHGDGDGAGKGIARRRRPYRRNRFTFGFEIRFAIPSQPLSFEGTAISPIPADPLRLALAEELLLALTFSCSRMVSVSPTLRGRRSSNMG